MREAGARVVAACVVGGLLVLVAPTTLAGTPLQPLVDATPHGGRLGLEPGEYDGPVRIERPIFLRASTSGGGTPPARIVAASDADAVITVDAADAHVDLQALTLAHARYGVRVYAGSVLVDEIRAESVGTLVRVEEGAVALRLGSSASGADATSEGPGRYITGRPFSLRAEGPDGAAVQGLVAELVDSSGRVLARWRSLAIGEVEVFQPLVELKQGQIVERGTFVWRLHAPGYATAEVSTNATIVDRASFAYVVRLTPTGGASTGPGLWDLMSSQSRAAVAALGATVLAGGAAVMALRHEHRRFRLLVLVAPLATRLHPSRLLDHETRERIHREVRERPGTAYRELARRLALPNGVLAHHLGVLVRERYVRAERHAYRVRFFAADASPAPAVAADTRDRVLALVRTRPGASGGDLARELAISPPLVSYHLARLERDGLIVRRREGTLVRVFPRDA